MLREGDKVIVGRLGGKDSLSLLRIMKERMKFVPINYEIVACFVDMGFSWVNKDILIKHFEEESIPYVIADPPEAWKGRGRTLRLFLVQLEQKKGAF